MEGSGVVSEFGVVLFYNTSGAFRGEKAAHGGGLDVKLIPTPRQLSSDCGVALRFRWTNEGDIRRLLAGAAVEYAGIHELV